MNKSSIIYSEKSRLIAKYKHPQSNEHIEYKTLIEVKDQGKQPVSIKMQYDTFPTGYSPMPPEEHTVRAKDILELYKKLDRWLYKYGYVIK